MKRYLLALICLNCLVSLVYAQEETRIEEKDTLSSLESEVGLIPESLDANVDSLLRTWHVQYFSKREDFCHDDDENVYFPDSVYIDRLSRLPSVIALPYNNIVRDCIDLYAERKRNLVRYMLGMADFYFPIIEHRCGGSAAGVAGLCRRALRRRLCAPVRPGVRRDRLY